jgi:hypothetical protein
MAIPDPPPDPTHYRILLSDPEGYDTVAIQRLLEDCGLNVLRVEELSWSEIDWDAKKASEKAEPSWREDRKAG